MCCLEYDEDLDEEFEEKPSKNKEPKISNFDTLKKYFDVVELEEKELFDLFICKNKVNQNKLIQYEVWLCTKIKKGKKEDFAKDVLTYIDKLINHDKKNIKQLSLFDEEFEEKSNKKSIDELSFWACINDYFIFDYDDYLDSIPQTNEEMIAFVKECITLYLENPNKEYDFFDFDYEFSQSEPISDREILSILYMELRMYFGLSTYVEDRYMIDMSNTIHKTTYKGEICKRFYSSYHSAGLKIESIENNTKFYDLYNKEFCSWLREKFNIPYKEPLTDKEVIKDSFISFARKFFEDENQLYYYINTSKNEVDFRKTVISFIREKNESGHMGSAGGPFEDCYSFSYTYDINHLHFRVSQRNEYRKQLGREIVGDKHSYTNVLCLEGHEIFEVMYQYLSDKPTYIQGTLF